MKRFVYVVLIIILILGLLKACIRRDIPETHTLSFKNIQETALNYPPNPKNVTIKGIDYLQSQAPIGKFGGALISSTIGEGPKTFNPFTAKDATSATMSEHMYDGLVTTHPVTGEVTPKLAKSFSVNGAKVIVNLRHGITWSDGKPITADDVVFTWRDIILKGLGNTSIRDMLIIDGKLPTVQKIDNYTVEFVLPQPFAPFLRMLSTSIAPKHIFAPAARNGAKYFDGFLSTTTPPEKFVTSGAFRLQEYKAAQRVVFVRNPNYYGINSKEQKLPYLDKLIYLIVGDLNNEVLKFEAKELDTISLRGSNVARYKAQEASSDFKIYNLGADTGTMFLALNLNNRKNDKGNFYVNQIKQSWFSNLNFRKAIDFALDRDSMVQNVANGLASPLFTAESLNSIFLNKNIKGHARDLVSSRALLKKAGFTLKDGTLYDKFGNRVEFDLYTNAGNTEREALGVMVKQDLADLGIKINFKPVEFNTLVNKLTNTLDWDMVIMGLTGSPLEPHNGKNVWYSRGSLHMFNQRLEKDLQDDRFYWEKELDTIIDKAALEVDFAARKQLYDRYQEIIYEQKPFIYLYSPIRVVAIRKKFGNIFPSPLAGVTYNTDEIYIK